jgi:hypothetical protein
MSGVYPDWCFAATLRRFQPMANAGKTADQQRLESCRQRLSADGSMLKNITSPFSASIVRTSGKGLGKNAKSQHFFLFKGYSCGIGHASKTFRASIEFENFFQRRCTSRDRVFR